MIAIEKVRHYGEAVAAVIAEDRYIAEDACDLIEVEYEPLPVVLDPAEARKDGAPLVHEKLETNVAYERTFSFGEVDRAFEEAPRKVQAKLRWPRSTGMPMDMNGAIGDYDAGTGVVTIYANSMTFTYFHWLIAGSLKIPTSKLRVVPIAAGGSFGSKFFMHKVPTFAGFLSKLVGQPVKYVEDRITHITNNDHAGSDRWYDAELAFDDDGTFRALRIGCVDDYGAYLQFGTGTHGNALSQIVGPYRIQHVEYSLAAILTNKNQQGAYRGFGAECSNWVLERLVDMAARELGMDRVEIRRQNLIGPDEFPYRTPTGNIYDSGNYQAVLEKILELADYDHWVAERDRLRAEGRHVGIGVVASNERSVFSLDGVLVLVRQAGVHADRQPGEREPPGRSRWARSSSRSTRRRSGATAPRRWSPRSSPRSSTSTRRRSSSRTPTRSTRSPAPGPAGRASRSWSRAPSPAPRPR